MQDIFALFFRELEVDIPAEELTFFKSLTTVRRVKKGTRLIEVGAKVREIYFVTKGLFRIYYVNADGGSFTRDFSWEGKPVAAYANLLTKTPSDICAEAIEDSEVLKFPYAALLKAYDRHVCWEKLGRRIAERYYIKREQRERQLATLTARERYEIFRKDYRSIVTRLTKSAVADFLAISPEALTRLTTVSKKSEG